MPIPDSRMGERGGYTDQGKGRMRRVGQFRRPNHFRLGKKLMTSGDEIGKSVERRETAKLWTNRPWLYGTRIT